MIYLISGVDPNGNGGSSHLLRKILTFWNGEFIYTPRRPPIRPLIVKKSFFRLIFYPITFLFYFCRSLKVSLIRNSSILIYHPQSLGYRRSLNLIKNNDKIYYYVLDNSFFCIRSYNNANDQECIKCLGKGGLEERLQECQPFPNKCSVSDNDLFLKSLHKSLGKIRFLAQNDNQESLLKAHFGSQALVSVVGMVTEDFDFAYQPSQRESGHDIVYHGGLSAVKGLNYTLSLAEELPSHRFLIPFGKEEVVQFSGGDSFPENITFTKMNWNNGLKDEVEAAGLVLCPSVWSAPIEGALIKSIIYNSNVAVLDSQFAFSKEAPEDALLYLTGSIQKDQILVRKFFDTEKRLNKSAREWAKKCVKLDGLKKFLEKIDNG